jgi:hypothetical protein
MTDNDDLRQAVRAAASDPVLMSRRFDLGRLGADVFHAVSVELGVAGSLIGRSGERRLALG